MSEPDPECAVVEFLQSAGLAGKGAEVSLTPLSGGVSSNLWRADLPKGSICVKGALSQLRVAKPWFAPVARSHVECEWLRFSQPICPGQVPRVLAESESHDLFAMEYFPSGRYPVWKTQLLAGHVDLKTARAVGELVGRLHAAGAADPGAPARFATRENFVALRLDPYLRVTAEAHPDLHSLLHAIMATTLVTERTVIHGDVSPKNILVGPDGPVLLDAECAWFGDPAFDVAFCLNHLLIKAIKLPSCAGDLVTAAQAFAEAYGAWVEWEPRRVVQERVVTLLPALALARVDGSSPVEYLDEAQRSTLRAVARDLLLDPVATLTELLERGVAVASRRTAPVS